MDDDANVDRVRPTPLRWIVYAYGAGLPPRYHTRVLHDVTTRTWVLRHITRSLVQFVPFAIVLFLVIPLDRVILGVGHGMGALIGVLFSTTFVDNVAESRAMKAGYPEGYAPRYAIVGRRTPSIDRDVANPVGFRYGPGSARSCLAAVGIHRPYVGQTRGAERDEMINEYERRILDAVERHECAADPRFAHRLAAASSWERWASAWRRLTTWPVLVLAVVVAFGAFALHVSAVGLLLTAWVSVAMAMRLIRSVWRGDAKADGREGPRNAASAGPDGAVL